PTYDLAHVCHTPRLPRRVELSALWIFGPAKLPSNVLPLTRPRAFRFLQRDATRRAETRRRRRRASERHAVGCCGRVGRLSPLESPKLQVNAPPADNHETRCCGEVR